MADNQHSVLIVTKQKGSGLPGEWSTEVNNLPDFDFSITFFVDLVAIIKDGTMQVFDMRSGQSIDAFDMVDIHNYGIDQAMASFMYTHLKNNNRPLFNTELANIWFTNHKLFEYIRFIAAGLPVIDTLFFHGGVDKPAAVEVIKNNGWTFPLIVKSATGIKGNDNYLVKTPEEFLELPLTDFTNGVIVQPFVENDGDYRVLLIGDEEPFIFKRSKSPDSHLNNTSQGASADILDPSDADYQALHELGDKARKAMNLQIAGIDVMLNAKTDEFVLLEVNYNPAIVMGFKKDEKVKLYIEYMKKMEQQL